ncbi:MAG TPA: SDR family oxidoreductase [Dermatophilaceae bacterium]|nr:SDR family oxidoreductase [Dermatophilaceae bacterium]
MPTEVRSGSTPSRGVLVTGSSRGVGAAVARAFAERGDRVVVHHRDNRGLAEQVRASLPGTGHAVLAADVSDPAQVAALASDAVAALGRVDVLVNNAARIVAPAGNGDTAGSRRGDHPLEHTAYEEWVEVWQATLATNLLGPAYLTWQVARHMLDVPPPEGLPVGRVVNVGSRGAQRGEPDIPAYGASKAGLHSFGQSMAQRLDRHGGVRAGRPGRRRGHARAEPVRAGGAPRGGRVGGRDPRRPGRGVGLRCGARPQRRQPPALRAGPGRSGRTPG